MYRTFLATVKKMTSFVVADTALGSSICKNIFWLTCGKIGGRLVRVIIVVYAARVLGASAWGAFSYVASLVAIFAVLTDCGISPTITREIAKSERENIPLVFTAVWLKSVLLLPALVFLYFFAFRLPALAGMGFFVGSFALLLFFDTFRQLGFSILKARQDMGVQASLYVGTNVLIVILGLAFLYGRVSIVSLASAYLIGSGIGASLTWLYLRAYIPRPPFVFDVRLAKKLLWSSSPFAVALGLGGMMVSIDIFFIGLMRPVAEVGFYSVADKLMQFLYAPSLVIATSVFPVLSRLAYVDAQKFRDFVRKVVRYGFMLGACASIVSIFLAPWVVRVLFGQEYLRAVLPLQILLSTLSLRFMSTIVSHALFASDARGALVRFTIIGIVVNSVLDILFIFLLGIVGAAVATVFAQGISTWYLWRKFRTLAVQPIFLDDSAPRL